MAEYLNATNVALALLVAFGIYLGWRKYQSGKRKGGKWGGPDRPPSKED